MPGAMLRHRSSKGLRLPVATGNYISTPDSVLNSITGDIDIRVYVKPDTWTTSVANGQAFIGRWFSGTTRQFIFGTNNAQNTFQFGWSIDGAAQSFQSSSVGVPFSDGQAGWCRVTFDVDNGSGQSDIKFYTSVDGLTWTQLGTTKTTTGVTSIFDSTSSLYLGVDNGGASRALAGVIYYAEVRNGIDGPVVARFDGSQVPTTGSQLPASINGWTWNGTGLYKRDDYVRFPGVSTNVLNYPDVANVYGDIDLRIKVSVDNIASTYSLLCKSQTGGQASWRWRYVNNTMEFGYYLDGTNLAASIGSSALGAVTGTPIWLRVTRTKSTGVQVFYTSSDGVTWTTNATSAPSDVGVSLFDGNSPLELGARFNNSDPLAGNIYYAEVRNGINGPVVAYWNGADNMVQTPWTINGSAWNWEASNFSGKPGIAYSAPLISGSYISTPDNNALDITSAIDIRAKVSLTNWADGVNFQGIVSKRAVGGQDAYQLRIDPTGELSLVIFSGGSNVGVPSTVPTGFIAGSIHWVRGTYIADNGAVGHTESYFTSDDGITWTPLGTPRVNAVVKPIDATTAALTLTTGDSGTVQLMKGNLYYAEVRNGIDGPIVAKFDATNIAKQNRVGNLLTPNQAGLEIDLTGWNATGSSTIARSTAQALDGVASLAITSTNGTTMFAQLTAVGINAIPVKPSTSYILSGWIRADTTGRQISLRHRWYDSGGAQLADASPTPVSDVSGSWTLFTATAASPSNAAFGTFYIQVSTPATSEIHYFDRMSFTETGLPVTTVQPGGSPNLLTPNQASIETDNSGWSVRANCTAPQSAVQALDGTKSLAITSVAAGDMSAFTLPGGVATAGVPVIPGKLYTAIVNTRADTTIRQFSSFIQWFNAAGSNLSTSFSIVPINNSTVGWTSNFVTVVAPAGAAFAATGAFILATGAAAEVHYVDRVSLVEAAEPWTINGTQWDWVNTPETTISVGGGSRILVEV